MAKVLTLEEKLSIAKAQLVLFEDKIKRLGEKKKHTEEEIARIEKLIENGKS